MRAFVAFAAFAVALAAPVSARAPADVSSRRGPFRVELLDASGAPLPSWAHRGATWVLGRRGERYAVRVRNGTARRVEVVVSVDGRDVRDGRLAAWSKRGYVVEGFGDVTIDGFRLSDASVAAFRFSRVADAYAARMGDARDVGVVGVALFEERAAAPVAGPEAEADAPAAGRAAPAPRPSALRKAEREGLGTAFGEQRESPVVHVAFERARETPDAILTARYDDRAGLVALGVDVDGCRDRDAQLRETAEPFRASGYAQPPPGWRPR